MPSGVGSQTKHEGQSTDQRIGVVTEHGLLGSHFLAGVFTQRTSLGALAIGGLPAIKNQIGGDKQVVDLSMGADFCQTGSCGHVDAPGPLRLGFARNHLGLSGSVDHRPGLQSDQQPGELSKMGQISLQGDNLRHAQMMVHISAVYRPLINCQAAQGTAQKSAGSSDQKHGFLMAMDRHFQSRNILV